MGLKPIKSNFNVEYIINTIYIWLEFSRDTLKDFG